MNNGAPAVDSSKQLGWVRRFAFRRTPGPAAVSNTPAPTDPLLEFGSEPARTQERAARSRTSPAPTRPNHRSIAWLLVLGASALAAVAVPTVGQLRGIAAKPPAPAFGKVSIETRPAGVKVFVDGENRGAAPLTLSLKAGAHAITLLNGAAQRKFAVVVTAGSDASRYVEFAPSEPTPSSGTISVTADVAGKVAVDGHPRGSTPLTLTDIPAGQHTVTVSGESGRMERTVTVDPGATASIVFSLPKAAGPTVGWLSVTAPFELQIYDAADLVGSGAAAKMMMTAGRHDVRLVNTGLEFETVRRVDVAPGKVAAVQVDAPMSTLSANARPWAEVVIDGTSLGQTPLSNVPIAGRQPPRRLQASATRRSGANDPGDGQRAQSDQRRHDQEETVMTIKISAAVLALVLGVGAPARGADRLLAAARELYASAAYEDALTMLKALAESQDVPRARHAANRRIPVALSVRAGRHGRRRVRRAGGVPHRPVLRAERRRSVAARGGMFTKVRRSLLPSLIREKYQVAKAAVDRADWPAAETLLADTHRLLAKAQEDGVEDSITDLRIVVDGFIDLARTATAKAVSTVPSTPAPAAAASGAPPRRRCRSCTTRTRQGSPRRSRSGRPCRRCLMRWSRRFGNGAGWT